MGKKALGQILEESFPGAIYKERMQEKKNIETHDRETSSGTRRITALSVKSKTSFSLGKRFQGVHFRFILEASKFTSNHFSEKSGELLSAGSRSFQSATDRRN